MSQNVKVIFSSIKSPNETLVHKSLEKLKGDFEVLVITSEKFAREWTESKCSIQIAKFDSTSKKRVFLRKFLLRSQILRRTLRFVLLHIFKNSKQIMMPPHNARHFEYLRAMELLDPSDWVILVDSRDLIFQISPQEIIRNINKSYSIHLFLESGVFFKNGQIQHNDLSPANWNWASQVLNGDLSQLEKLKGTEIVNSGCIVGRVEELRIFLKKSCDLLANSLHSSYALLDQASVNVLAYCFNDSSKVEIHANSNIVLNMCGVVSERAEIKEGKLFVSNALVPVVHQFDRFGTWDTLEGLKFDKRGYTAQNFS